MTTDTPKGKRTIRRSIYGNLNGYVSGRFWAYLGNAFSDYDQEQAMRWQNGEI